MKRILPIFLIFLFILNGSMTCGHWVKVASRSSFEIEPNPIILKDGSGAFDARVVIPNLRPYLKNDSLKVSCYGLEFNGFRVLGEFTVMVPKPWKNDLIRSETFQISEPLPDSTRIYVDITEYKKENSRRSPRLEIGLAVEEK